MKNKKNKQIVKLAKACAKALGTAALTVLPVVVQWLLDNPSAGPWTWLS